MDVKEAVATAKRQINDLFSSEGIEDLGLEEVEFDDSTDTWAITIGFSRLRQPIEIPPLAIASLVSRRRVRSYKVVRIFDANGKVLSVKSREPVE